MMPEITGLSVSSNPKPYNVFFIWYKELCRRSNSTPVAITRNHSKLKSNTVLDFEVDRLKYEEWKPLLSALKSDTSLHVIKVRSKLRSYEFLTDVDTEEKASKMKRIHGAIWSSYVLQSFLQALSLSMNQTQVLTSLELHGLPMFSQYLEDFLSALRGNTSIKCLSLTDCPIEDTGCRSVCLCLQHLPNIETINLSKCRLTSNSGINIAQLIKFQQLTRYTTTWQKSLRYAEPEAEIMRGIRRITLNGNPKIGNEGLQHILDQLEDDLWIKALDMQKCGITEKISMRIIDVVNYNRSLKIADFRHNNELNPLTLIRIFELLKTRNEQDSATDFNYQWCNTDRSSSHMSPTRDIVTSKEALSTTTSLNGIPKAKSFTKSVRSLNRIPSNGKVVKPEKIKLDVYLNQGLCTNNKNEFTQKSEVRRSKYSKPVSEYNHTLQTVMKSLEKFPFIKAASEYLKNDNFKNCTSTSSSTKTVKKNDKKQSSTSSSKGISKIKNGYTNFIIEKESVHNVSARSSVSDKFAYFCESQNNGKAGREVSDDEETLINYYLGTEDECQESKTVTPKRDEMSDSQISLLEYMQELEQDIADRHNDLLYTSEHHYKGEKKTMK